MSPDTTKDDVRLARARGNISRWSVEHQYTVIAFYLGAVSPAWLNHVTWDGPATLCCIVTAIDNSTGSGRASFPSFEHQQTAARRSPVRTPPGELKAEVMRAE